MKLDDNTDTTARETADSAFRYQALYQALRRLSDLERNTILLYYMEGYSVKEIAEMTRSAQDVVRQQMSRGRKHLKSLLNKTAI